MLAGVGSPQHNPLLPVPLRLLLGKLPVLEVGTALGPPGASPLDGGFLPCFGASKPSAPLKLRARETLPGASGRQGTSQPLA